MTVCKEDDLVLGFSIKELAKISLEKLLFSSTDDGCSFPEFFCRVSKNSLQGLCIGVYVSYDDFSYSLDEFFEKHLKGPISKLKEKINGRKLKDVEQKIPTGCFDSANFTIPGSGSIRLIIAEEPVPHYKNYPRGIMKMYYDINRESIFLWPLCHVIRFDVVLD